VERPILFNTEMVKKILSGEKTQNDEWYLSASAFSFEYSTLIGHSSLHGSTARSATASHGSAAGANWSALYFSIVASIDSLLLSPCLLSSKCFAIAPIQYRNASRSRAFSVSLVLTIFSKSCSLFSASVRRCIRLIRSLINSSNSRCVAWSWVRRSLLQFLQSHPTPQLGQYRFSLTTRSPSLKSRSTPRLQLLPCFHP